MSRSPRVRSTWCPGIEIAEAFPTAAAVRKEIDHLSVGANNIDLGRTDEYTSVISPAPVAEDSVLAIVMTGNGQRVLPRGRKIGNLLVADDCCRLRQTTDGCEKKGANDVCLQGFDCDNHRRLQGIGCGLCKRACGPRHEPCSGRPLDRCAARPRRLPWRSIWREMRRPTGRSRRVRRRKADRDGARAPGSEDRSAD